MKKFIKSIIIFCVFFGTVNVYAQENPEKLILTLDDAVKYALENNISLKSAAIDLEITRRADENSWNVLLPSAQIRGTIARSNNIDSIKNSIKSNVLFPTFGGMLKSGMDAKTAFTTASSSVDSITDKTIKDLYGNEEGALWHPVGALTFTWNFNIAMLQSMKVAKAKYEAGEISYEKTVTELESNVKKLFYGILLMQENLNIKKDSLNNAKARYEQAEINYKNGLVPELSVLNSRVTYENMKPDILSAEQTIKQNKDTFAFLLGLPFGKEIELKGKIDAVFVDVNPEVLFTDFCNNNKDIQNLKKQMEVAENGLSSLKLSTFTPSLSVSWGLSPTVSNITKNWFDKDNYNDSGNLSFTLVYSNLIDMLPFSSNMQKIKDTEQTVEKLKYTYSQLVQNTQIQVYTLSDNLKKCKANIQAMENNVELARKAYNSTLKAYNNGTQELLAVKDSESSLNQARLGLMNEKLNYINAVLDIETKFNIKLTK